MKLSLGKSVAEFILAENERQKEELTSLRRDLKKIEDKMMEALDNLSQTYSSRLKGYQKLLLFDNPYQCLTAFVEEIIKSAIFSISTAEENESLKEKNIQLHYKIESVEKEMNERKLKEEETIDLLNEQIEEKKFELNKLEEDYQSVLKAKRVAEKELGDTKEHMKILRLKLYEEQREKLTEIIVANKKEMIDFRRSMEMEAYKLELEYKKNMEEKEIEIRTLTQNIEELINNKLTHMSDLTVLEKIVHPMRDTTMLKAEIIQLKKEVVEMRHEIRDKHGVILGLEGKVADVTMSRDNLVSYNERLVIEKNLLSQELKETKESLEKAIGDRQALDIYYGEKWHTEFSKVKSNLEEKFTKKNEYLVKEFEKKRKEVEAEILGYVERLRVMKSELEEVKRRNEELVGVNEMVKKEMGLIREKNVELMRVVKEADKFHNEELRMVANKLGNKIIQLEQENYNLTETNSRLQFELSRALMEIEILEKSHFEQKRKEIEEINLQHRREIEKLKKEHKREIELLEISYGNMNQMIQEAISEEKKKYEMKEKQLLESHQEKIKEVNVQCEIRVKKINEKLSESESRYHKLRRVKEEELQYTNKKLEENLNIQHEHEKELITRDVEIEEYKKMRETYMGEVARLNSLLNEEVFLRQSLKVELETTLRRLDEKQKAIHELESKKHIFKQELSEFEKLYKKQFSELQSTHKKINTINKRKVKELELMFENRPIKQQHFEKIKSLEKTNSELRTEIHLKEAENVILNEVKEYYENRAFYLTGNVNQNHKATIKNEVVENNSKQELLSTCNFLKTANSFMRPGTNHAGSSIVKKYRSRKNKLITSSYNKFDAFQEEEKVGKEESSEISKMKRYLMKQHCRGNGVASEFKKGEELRGHERTKSSIG